MGTLKGLIGSVAGIAIVTLAWTTVAAAQAGSGQPGVAAFLSAVNSSADELKALNAEKSISTHDIHTVSVEKISNAGNTAAISRAIAKNSAQIAALRDALKTNQTVLAALTGAGVSIDQVVAIDVDPGSEIHVFYR
jgi:hypothetical protein